MDPTTTGNQREPTTASLAGKRLTNSRRSTQDTPAEFSAARPPYYANRVLRLAIKDVLAQRLGPDCLALLCVIAMTEDARRYRGPVTFWTNQLLPLVGFAKWERLDRARRKLVDADWLLYVPGGRSRPGEYRVTFPQDLAELSDTAVDEGLYPGEGYQQHGGDSPDPPIDPPQTDTNRESSGGSTRRPTGGSSLPEPVPDPLPLPEGGAAGADLSTTEAEFKETWNAAGLPQCRDLTDKRRRTLRSRLSVPEWSANWREGIQRAQASAFCRGKNDRDWKATIDWFLKPDSLTKLLEGAYDDRKGGRTAESGLMDSLQRFVDGEGKS